MNELMINLYGGDYIYYATECTTADEAYSAFQDACEAAGINIDNVTIESLTLRNDEGEDIDAVYGVF